jgi:dihydrofolate synthase/folylpolyglutamate synthase
VGVRLNDSRAALDYLFARTTGGWRLGTERTLALLAEMGNPHRQLQYIHVGGTNGKGSVCATIEAVLRARGFTVGTYTSPHLVDFGERIRVNGTPLAAERIAAFVRQWSVAIERVGATFFEATTALAFDELARAAPDIVVLEVGLGGRLDATNVVDPLLSVVTNVGLDHTEYLGTTRDAIAYEKAGIFKAERAAVIGEPDARVRSLLADQARAARAAPTRLVQDEVVVDDIVVRADRTEFTLRTGVGSGPSPVRCRTALVGAHQAHNAATALVALTALPPPFTTSWRDAIPALRSVVLPGRFQRSGRFIFDVAHNREGASVLAATLRRVAPVGPVGAVLAVLRDKDWQGMMQELAPAVDEFVLTTAPSAPAPRAWDPRQAHQFATERGWKSVVVSDLDLALDQTARRCQTVLVTGSFHTVGDAMLRLHVSPLRS